MADVNPNKKTSSGLGFANTGLSAALGMIGSAIQKSSLRESQRLQHDYSKKLLQYQWRNQMPEYINSLKRSGINVGAMMSGNAGSPSASTGNVSGGMIDNPVGNVSQVGQSLAMTQLLAAQVESQKLDNAYKRETYGERVREQELRTEGQDILNSLNSVNVTKTANEARYVESLQKLQNEFIKDRQTLRPYEKNLLDQQLKTAAQEYKQIKFKTKTQELSYFYSLADTMQNIILKSQQGQNFLAQAGYYNESSRWLGYDAETRRMGVNVAAEGNRIQRRYNDIYNNYVNAEKEYKEAIVNNASEQVKAQKMGNWLHMIGIVGGAAIGGFLGGPAGVPIGAAVGSSLTPAPKKIGF